MRRAVFRLAAAAVPPTSSKTSVKRRREVSNAQLLAAIKSLEAKVELHAEAIRADMQDIREDMLHSEQRLAEARNFSSLRSTRAWPTCTPPLRKRDRSQRSEEAPRFIAF